jgi:Tol biopolymer transport system component
VLGGAAHRLPLSPLSAVSFSPDGRRFGFVQTNAAAGESLVKVVNRDGSDVSVLARRVQPAYFDFVGPTVSWARDGALIAAVVADTDAGGDYMTVVGLRTDGGAETRLTTKRWAGVSEVTWSRAGGLVVVAQERPASPSQVWLVASPGGDAVPLTSDLNAYSSLSVTAAADTLMLVQRNSIASLWVQSTARETRDAQQIGSEVGGFGDLVWTPDGRLMYRSTKSGESDLWMVGADGQSPAQVTTDARASQGLAVTPDGRYVVFAASRSGGENLWRYGLGDGGLTQLTDGDGEVLPRTSADGQWVIYQRGSAGGKPTLWRVAIDGGALSQVVATHAMRHDLSPDGRSVAYFSMDLRPDRDPEWRIVVASVHDGSPVTSFEIPATAMPRVLRFTPDGQGVAYIDTAGGVGNIWQQPIAGGARQRVTAFDQGGIDTFAYSHDGRRLAITRATQISDVALIRIAE